MNDKELHAYCEEWVDWCYTRRFYIQSGTQSLLARMQPSKTGLPPNARNSPDMQYFNMAIHMLADMSEYAEGWACFRLMYVEQAANVKRLAHDMGISRMAYYKRSRTFSRRAFSMSLSLKKAREMMRDPETTAA